MIIQPDKGARNVNELFYEAERKRIDMLNQEFFHDVQLSKNENDVLVWLCGWDDWTIKAIMDAFRKVRNRHEEIYSRSHSNRIQGS